MKVSIENVEVPIAAINSFQLMSNWNSLYSKGRLLLSADKLNAQSIVSSNNFFAGANITFEFESNIEKKVYYQVFAFNLLQGVERDGRTAGELVELILVSPWYIDAPLKDKAYDGSCSEIIKDLIADSSSFSESVIENTADPVRRRYQLGVTHWKFAESLKPYLTADKSPSFLFNDFFGKKLNLRTFSSIREKDAGLAICSPDSTDKVKKYKQVIYFRDITFYYNSNKEIEDTYSISEISKELFLKPNYSLSYQILESTGFETLPPYGSAGYINHVKYSSWDHSPTEQRVLANREKFVREIEYNSTSIIFNSIFVNIELADKIYVDLNKPTEFHDSLLSTDYIVKDILISYDAENEDNTFTKVIGIPLINFD